MFAWLAPITFYWHTLDTPKKGLAYTGITLIPPSSMSEVVNTLQDFPTPNELKDLLLKARMENKYIIHFGI